MDTPNTGLRIDLGCGAIKKEGTLGIDIEASPGVDYTLDIENSALPFSDGSVVYVHSSHFLEHTQNPTNIFAKISQVCADGARIELWTPYAWSNPAFISGHKFFFTEDIYLHMCSWFIDFWQKILGARWVLEEFQYVVDPRVLCYLKAKDISLDYALRHLQNVVTEFGTFITVRKTNAEIVSPPLRRTFSTARLGPRYEVQVDPGGYSFGAVGVADYPQNEAIEEAIRTFASGTALPALDS